MQEIDVVLSKMEKHLEEWKSSEDLRHVFLSCYHMMSAAMNKALQEREFHDTEWVNRLLHRFADYYFESLVCYDCGENTPKVWLYAHQACKENRISELQLLILGVNAHINYDLVLALYDMLAPEWKQLSESKKRERYEDHKHVNHVIGSTIDQVQDDLLEPMVPSLEWIDVLFGRVDEFLISRLISHWRDDVWENSQKLLEMKTVEERERFHKQIEKDVLKVCETITLF